MADGQIDIKEDAAPTKELATQTHLHGATTVHAEEVVIVDAAGNLVGVTAGALKVDGSAVTQPVSDGGGALTVDALDFDIRNLTHVASQDSVRLGDGTDLVLVTAAGELNVLATAQPGVDIGDVTVNNAAGAAAVNIQDGGNSITVDGTVAVSGTVTTADANLDNATLVDNNAFADGTTRVVMDGFVFDDVAGTALTENDAAAARIDSKRAQVLVIEDATTRGQKATVTAAGAVKVDGSAVTQPVSQATASSLNAQVVGEVAHDSVDSGNPQKMGAQARTTNPTAVADADRTNLIADDVGRQVVRIGHVRDLITSATTTISNSSTETTILTAVASTFLDVTAMTIANTSATGIRVDIRDTTGGSVVMSLYVPATQTVGFSLTRPFNQTSVNTNWTAQCSSAVTDIRIWIQAEKNV